MFFSTYLSTTSNWLPSCNILFCLWNPVLSHLPLPSMYHKLWNQWHSLSGTHKLIASLSYISIICQFIRKEWMTCLLLELVMTGHLKTYWWYVRQAFWLKCGTGLASQTPFSPYSSQLVSHAFVYLYYFKWTVMSQGSIQKACPRVGRGGGGHKKQK